MAIELKDGAGNSMYFCGKIGEAEMVFVPSMNNKVGMRMVLWNLLTSEEFVLQDLVPSIGLSFPLSPFLLFSFCFLFYYRMTAT